MNLSANSRVCNLELNLTLQLICGVQLRIIKHKNLLLFSLLNLYLIKQNEAREFDNHCIIESQLNH